MPVFEVLLHGEGLKLLSESGEICEGGVYFWQRVRAPSEEEAVAQAKEAAISDPHLAIELHNQTVAEITFSVDKIVKPQFWKRRKNVAPILYIDTEERIESN